MPKEENTHDDESADEDVGGAGACADNFGDEIGRHADDADQRHELHGAGGGEGVPKGAKTRHGTHDAAGAAAGAVVSQGAEFCLECFG